MLLAFTAIVLVGAVVPLTLNATMHDRSSFAQAAAGEARTDAVFAQAYLDLKAESKKHHNSVSVTAQANSQFLNVAKEARQAGDGLLVLTNKYKVLGNKVGVPAGNWDQFASYANQQAQSAVQADEPVQAATEIVGSYMIAAMPVYSASSLPDEQWVGTVILAKSTASLDHEILALWLILGTIAVVAMIAAALMAFGLARWVSRPLKSLDTAARRLADGDMAIRAKVGSGPPELRRLGTTFNTMAGRLEALVHGNRAVIADVSHQLRTPLAALRLRLDLLAADTDPETGHELAGALDEPVVVDVAEVASERVVAWHPVADDRSIVLVATTAGNGSGLGSALGVGRSTGTPVLAWIGEGHLEQILDNLIANALEALNPGNLVRLTTSVTTSGVRITVSDNGPGMSAEDRDRAFLRFTTSSPNGTGLGLAIVHRLAISNGGTAGLDETPGGGLTVTLDFPGVPVTNGSVAAPGTSSTSIQDVISL
jgi:signal transduction histidine kinase